MFLSLAERLVGFLVGGVSNLFLSLGSSFSLASLLSALCVAITFLLVSRGPGKKVVKYKVMFRALFPRWVSRASFKADVWFLLLNLFASGLLVGWTVISSRVVSQSVAGVLVDIFGVESRPGLNA